MSFLIDVNNKNEISEIHYRNGSSTYAFIPDLAPLTSNIKGLIKNYFFNDSPSSRVMAIYLDEVNREAVTCKSHLDVLCSDTDTQAEIKGEHKYFTIFNKQLYEEIRGHIDLACRFEQLKIDAQNVWSLMRAHLEKAQRPVPDTSHFSFNLVSHPQRLNMSLCLSKPMIEVDLFWLYPIEELPAHWSLLSDKAKTDYISSIVPSDYAQAHFLAKMLYNPQKWFYARLGILAHEMAHHVGHDSNSYIISNLSLLITHDDYKLKQLAEINADLLAAQLGPLFREGLIHLMQSADAAYPSVDLGIENLGNNGATHPPHALRARLLASGASSIFDPKKP